MGEELFPCIECEGRVERGEFGDEVVFEGADGSLGPVGAVHARWCELHVSGGALAEGLGLSTHFVVEVFEAWGLGTVRFEELTL